MAIQKPQICVIHGGTVYESDAEYQQALRDLTLNYDRLLYAPSWKHWLAEQLPDHDVLLPTMPNGINAKYDDWALFFSKVVAFLRPDAILIGHSLGGIFLAKYFSENPPAEPFRKLILIAAPYADEANESLGDFKLSSSKLLESAAREIHLMHSLDDPVVPIGELERYAADLPDAIVHRYTNKHHFIDSDLPDLLEIIAS